MKRAARTSWARKAWAPILLTLAASATAPARAAPAIPADAVIPLPTPQAPPGSWTDAPGRHRVAIAVPGATLRGFVFDGGRPNGPLVLAFLGNHDMVLTSAPQLAAFGRSARSVLAIDYRGFGLNAGAPPHLDTMRDDALALFDEAAKRAGGARHVVVLGFSLGTAIAVHVAAERHPGGVVLIAPIANAAAEIPRLLQLGGLGGARFDNSPALVRDLDETGMIARSRAPLLVVHSREDEIVSFPQGQAVFAASPSPEKSFVPLARPGHLPSFLAPETADAVAAFLRRDIP